MRAISSEAWPTVSRPSKVTEPSRLSTMPMTDLSVVVLPTPLRPSRVTSSPRPISKPTPCRICDSPYQACSPSTLSNASTMAGSDIGLDHGGIPGHRGVGPLGQDLAARQHRDGVGEVGDHGHVVLDHQHGAVLGDGADQRRDSLDVLLAEPRHRLV